MDQSQKRDTLVSWGGQPLDSQTTNDKEKPCWVLVLGLSWPPAGIECELGLKIDFSGHHNAEKKMKPTNQMKTFKCEAKRSLIQISGLRYPRHLMDKIG